MRVSTARAARSLFAGARAGRLQACRERHPIAHNRLYRENIVPCTLSRCARAACRRNRHCIFQSWLAPVRGGAATCLGMKLGAVGSSRLKRGTSRTTWSSFLLAVLLALVMVANGDGGRVFVVDGPEEEYGAAPRGVASRASTKSTFSAAARSAVLGAMFHSIATTTVYTHLHATYYTLQRSCGTPLSRHPCALLLILLDLILWRRQALHLDRI